MARLREVIRRWLGVDELHDALTTSTRVWRERHSRHDADLASLAKQLALLNAQKPQKPQPDTPAGVPDPHLGAM